MKFGDSNEKVKKIQRALKKMGYQITADGKFGVMTENAVKDFQSKNNLEVDGIAGIKTQIALGVLKTGIPAMTPNSPSTYPNAIQCENRMKERGNYSMKGAVVHFTAGHTNANSGQAAIDLGIQNGYTYLVIDPKGVVYQAHDLNKWGHHCGASYWHSLGTSLSNELIGIEICNAGRLSKVNGKYFAWFKKEIPEADVRETTSDYQGTHGFYQKYSEAQEASLIKLLIWLKYNFKDFSFDHVLGHDEVSPNRKDDPGGALSMPMPKFREFLKKSFEELEMP